MKYLKFGDIKIGDRVSQDVYPEEAFQVDRKRIDKLHYHARSL